MRTLLIIVHICAVLSLAATLATYNIHYTDPHVVDASFVYRGWPLPWIVESWSLWGRPPYYHVFNLQPLNFLVDLVFWTVVFQLLPLTLHLFLSHKKKQTTTQTLQAQQPRLSPSPLSASATPRPQSTSHPAQST